ncbi:putative E3 ubiquitin-protein ligase RING1a isoform X2 [Abrus precatorius]|uniref:E3 ubiquitin-protein ligase RING1a isoform X2 n=1 Tax=Abrus precatorius TaxID=3816 RepID=A0A8B8KU44_ABRPR|nr:putative E3 ubiquitin-protein ligase RING1a isoform X2 [Abrus precatorius]
MPAQRRSNDASEVVALRNDHEQPEDEVESDRSGSLSDEDKDEFVVVKLSDIRKEVQCPICLGIIRKTRTVMECLHRFCRECIDKSMRLGNNECPACRTHCASRRSLRDDPNYDALIAALYPNIDKYEEEELALHADEVIHNNQVQASIAQTLRRQTEALSKKRNAKATTIAFVRRSQGNYRTSHLRRRRSFVNAGELQVSNENEYVNDNDARKDSSSGDEPTETRSRRGRRGRERETQFPHHFATADGDGTGDENIPEVTREITSPSGTLAWGKNGHRSHTRANGKNARNSRLSKLVDHLRNSEVNDDKLEIPLMLVSLDEQRIPSLHEPYLYCKPTLSVKQLCQFVAIKTMLLADEVELCLVEEPQASIIRGKRTVEPDKDKLRVLGDQETLAELGTYHNVSCGHLLFAYKLK